MRIFCALRLPDEVLDALVEWQAATLRDGRVVPGENLHVTLAFLGSVAAADVPGVVGALREAAGAARPVELEPDRMRGTRSVVMLVLRDMHGTAAALAGDLFGRLESLGVYRREQRPWLPHVTVLRVRERVRALPPPPRLPRFAPSDAAVYLSVLRPSGAQYHVLESVRLGG
jgi:2'-5' RNA ligase